MNIFGSSHRDNAGRTTARRRAKTYRRALKGLDNHFHYDNGNHPTVVNDYIRNHKIF